MIVYADTSWWVALKNSGDAFHESALEAFDLHKSQEVIWTPWHRFEVFNAIRQAERLGFLRGVSAGSVIRAIENEVRLGYWPHMEFDWIDAVRIANELSADHSRNMPIRGMDLFHIAIACEVGAGQFLTFDDEQAGLAKAAGLAVWKGTR